MIEKILKDILLYEIYPKLNFMDIINLTAVHSVFGKIIENDDRYINLYKIQKYFKKHIYLYKHQIKSLLFINNQEQRNNGGLLNIKMGLGKTNIAISYCLTKKIDKCLNLIITKKTIMTDWINNLQNIFNNKLKILYFHRDIINIDNVTVEQLAEYHIVVTTYNIIARACSHNNLEDRVITKDQRNRVQNISCADKPLSYKKGVLSLFSVKWNRIFFDEIHICNNVKSYMFKGALNLYAKYRWAMSGTPIINKKTDMFSLMKILNLTSCVKPKIWDTSIFYEEKLNTHILTLDYQDTDIVLPQKQIFYSKLNLNKDEHSIYKIIEDRAKLELLYCNSKGTSYTIVLVLFMLLRQCCISHSLLKNKENINKLIKNDPSAKKYIDTEIPSTKIKYILSLIKNNKKIVIFSFFRESLKELNKYIDQKTCMVSGGQTKSEQNDQLNIFKESKEHNILLITYKVGAEGINLTCASEIILMDPWWNNVVTEQAIARLWRIGQVQDIKVHHILMENTIEEEMIKICKYKKEMTQQYIINQLFQ